MKLNKITADMVSRRPDQTAEWLNRLARQVDIVETDLGSMSKKPWDLPIATTYSLGVIKVGQNLSITPEGVLSALAPASYDYTLLFNKPKINNVELVGNKSLSDIGVGDATIKIQKNSTDVGSFTTNSTTNTTIDISVPTKTSDITNDGADGTSTYVENDDLTTALAGKQDTLTAGTNININSNTISTQTRGIEYIIGTQTAATNVWLGTSTDAGCSSGTLYTGKTIVYHLPYAGTSSAATLNLTLPDGTTTGAKNVRYNTGSNVGTTYGAGCDIFMVYDGTYWKTSAWYDSNNYDRIRYNNSVKAAAAISSGRVCVGTDAGYIMAAANATFDINYPILWSGSAVNSGATNTNFYGAINGVNLANTKSGWSGTINKMSFLVGTLSGTTFTIDSAVFTQTVPNSEDGKVYIPLGITYSTTNILFYPNNTYWAYKNGEFRPISHSEPVMTGASSGTAGAAGLVPAPAAGDDTKFLSGDGLWKTVSQYSLPIATANDLGGIKVGSRLTINSTTGVLSADSQTDNNFTTTLKDKLDGIAAGAEVNVQANWTEADSSSDAYIKNKPSLATVATSGSYNDLTNKPTIPTVNNATLTIQKNGSSVGTFTANASSNVTANIVTDELKQKSDTRNSMLPSDANYPSMATLHFSSFGGLDNQVNNSKFTDVLMLNSWANSSGGRVNAIVASKTDTQSLWHYTGAQNGNSWNGAKQIAYVSDIPTKTSDLTNDSGFITSSGTVAKADQLTNARTIAIGTGAVGTATSFNGTSNITIPITSVYETYLAWGNQNLSGKVSCVDAAMGDEFSANRLAYMSAAKITVEYSRDGGSTWTDYGLSDADKISLVTITKAIYTGGTSSDAAGNYQVRVNLNPTNPYMSTRKLFLYVSTNGVSNAQVLIEKKAMGGSTYETVKTATVSGWSGWNSIPLSLTFGGSSSWSNSDIRLTFSYDGKSTSYPNAQLAISKIRLYGETAWSAPSNLATNGHLYSYDANQNATFPANLKIEGSQLQHSSYGYTLPNKSGTLAMTSDLPTVNNATLTIQKNSTNVATFTANASSNVTANISVPTKTSELTNDSGFVTDTSSQSFAAQEGSTNPVFDDMTPVRTIEWDVSDTTYRPIYQMENTGWTYDNMDVTLAYRITVTGTNIKSVSDVVARWHSPNTYPVTSILHRTLSTSASTTGLRYLRAVYPTSSYVNNNTYKFGQEVAMYNSTARHVKVEVFKNNSKAIWSETKPAGSIYQGSSTYQSTNNLEPYATRGWYFRGAANVTVNNADAATRISDYESYSPGSSVLKSGATALVAGHFAFLAEDGLVYDISNTAKAISVGESKVGWIASGVNANTAINQTYWRMISRPNATQYGYFGHDTSALGDRVYLRCTMDSSGKIHSDNYLAKEMSPGYTWMPMGFMTAATTFYADTRFPKFYTLDANGNLTHIDGKAISCGGSVVSVTLDSYGATTPWNQVALGAVIAQSGTPGSTGGFYEEVLTFEIPSPVLSNDATGDNLTVADLYALLNSGVKVSLNKIPLPKVTNNFILGVESFDPEHYGVFSRVTNFALSTLEFGTAGTEQYYKLERYTTSVIGSARVNPGSPSYNEEIPLGIAVVKTTVGNTVTYSLEAQGTHYVEFGPPS